MVTMLHRRPLIAVFAPKLIVRACRKCCPMIVVNRKRMRILLFFPERVLFALLQNSHPAVKTRAARRDHPHLHCLIRCSRLCKSFPRELSPLRLFVTARGEIIHTLAYVELLEIIPCGHFCTLSLVEILEEHLWIAAKRDFEEGCQFWIVRHAQQHTLVQTVILIHVALVEDGPQIFLGVCFQVGVRMLVPVEMLAATPLCHQLRHFDTDCLVY
mmetsp:Transcript_83927/g.145785  ORF Transcript_83927/g.145785 Transcript_83927/m.145785 type:complete len:214 (+) Transcript_83927:654-1295(+)